MIQVFDQGLFRIFRDPLVMIIFIFSIVYYQYEVWYCCSMSQKPEYIILGHFCMVILKRIRHICTLEHILYN